MIRPTFFILLLTFFISATHAQSGTYMVIDGLVKDMVTGKPITGASISNNAGYSPVSTDNAGRFKAVILSDKPVGLSIHKEGYKPIAKTINPQPTIQLEIGLEPIELRPIIRFSEFRKNSYIRGVVEGISQAEVSAYKILVYVLTDKWYIHPYAVNDEGRGYASIKGDGSWQIGTIYRGYQAYKVAFLLVESSTYAPSTVSLIKGDPEQELLSRIKTVDSLFIEAPKGI